MTTPRPEYPRPHFDRSHSWLTLNGTWDFRADPAEAYSADASDGYYRAKIPAFTNPTHLPDFAVLVRIAARVPHHSTHPFDPPVRRTRMARKRACDRRTVEL